VHLQHTQAGNEAGAGRLLSNSFDEIAADLKMIEFGNRAGVEKNGQPQLS
jgi:hypothetical protein